MEIKSHILENINIAEIISDSIVIENVQDGVDLLGNLYYESFNRVIVHEKNITPDFFDLKNGIAGEILQKFSNYQVRLAIVGDFTKYTGKSINDFIYECNSGKKINFVDSIERALLRLAK